MNVDSKKLIKEIVNQWKFIFQLSFFLFASSLVYVFFFYQHEYTSSSKVYLSDKSSNQLSLGGLSQFGLQMPFSQGSATGKLSIVSELVGSFSFLEKILNDDVRISENEFTSLYNYLNQDGLALGLENWPKGSSGSAAFGLAGQWNDISRSNQLTFIVEMLSDDSGNSEDSENSGNESDDEENDDSDSNDGSSDNTASSSNDFAFQITDTVKRIKQVTKAFFVEA